MNSLEKFGIFSLIGFFIFILIIEPFIVFWLGYFSGWLAKIFIGKHLVKGLALLGLTVPLDKIPLLGGVLAWIGGFFKNINSTKLNNN